MIQFTKKKIASNDYKAHMRNIASNLKKVILSFKLNLEILKYYTFY